MEAPLRPENESLRLKALQGYQVLDTAAEQNSDDIVALASAICGTPIALISLVDENRQWFKSRIGLSATETPRDISFCGHAINQTAVFEIPDASQDSRFADNPLVTEGPRIRFYAGAPLKTLDGFNIGTLCVIDHEPRVLTPQQKRGLEALARQVIANFERQRLAAVLQTREKFMARIMGALPDLISYVDTDFRYLYANPTYTNWLERENQEIIGKMVVDVIGEAAFAIVKPYFDKAMSGESQQFFAKLPYRVNSGTLTRSVHVQYIPDKDENNKVLGVNVVVQDLTAIRKAELEARTTEGYFRAIFENSPQGIIQLNSRFHFIAANNSYLNMLGYTWDELKSRSMIDLTHPADRGLSQTAAQSAGESMRPVKQMAKRYLRKDGQTVWAKVSSRPVRLSESDEVIYVSVIEDITEEKAREVELETARASMVNSSRMAELGEMASGVAHEINNPLAVIQGKLFLINKWLEQGTVAPDKLKSELDTIHKTSDRIAKIIKGLRFFSRESGDDPLVPTTLTSIVEETMTLCQEKMRLNSVEVRITVPEELVVDCRSAQIGQVLLNLLHNSLDAIVNQPQKWIDIRGSRKDQHIELRVTDSGLGIPTSVQTKMMQPFFTTKEVGKGTGLGLSISKGIVEAHGGEFYYDALSKNTCFVISMPASAAKAKAGDRASCQ